MCTPYIERQKWLPWQHPLGARYRQYLQSVGRPLNPPITNCVVAIVLTKPVIAILVPKLVAMATTLRHLISAMSSSVSLTPKTHLYNQTLCHYLSYNQSYSLLKAKKPVTANCVTKLVAMATSLSIFGPPSNTWFPGPTRVLNPNSISISSAVFAGFTSLTDRPTDHATGQMTQPTVSKH